MGTWPRLHPDVKEATLEDKLARLRGRIKHENPARKELHILNEKLVHLQNLKDSIIKELSQDVCNQYYSATLVRTLTLLIYFIGFYLVPFPPAKFRIGRQIE